MLLTFVVFWASFLIFVCLLLEICWLIEHELFDRIKLIQVTLSVDNWSDHMVAMMKKFWEHAEPERQVQFRFRSIFMV
jgi:hypothetical protein